MGRHRENHALLHIGVQTLSNTAVPLSTRIKSWRTYLRDYRRASEQIMMEQFKEKNGFDAEDDDAKRALVDGLYYEVFQTYPKGDMERNEYTKSHEGLDIMRIGWRRT